MVGHAYPGLEVHHRNWTECRQAAMNQRRKIRSTGLAQPTLRSGIAGAGTSPLFATRWNLVRRQKTARGIGSGLVFLLAFVVKQVPAQLANRWLLNFQGGFGDGD